MKRRLWSLQFGDRGFIFSLDAVIAITVVFSLLTVSAFYIIKAGDESVSKLQTIRIGSDVLALLEYDGTLNTLSVDAVETELNRILPINYHMRIKVNCKGKGELAAETTDIFPKDRFIGAGKRVFVSNNSDYCIADFNIWLK